MAPTQPSLTIKNNINRKTKASLTKPNVGFSAGDDQNKMKNVTATTKRVRNNAANGRLTYAAALMKGRALEGTR